MQRSDDFNRVGPLGSSILALVRYVTALPPALPKDPDGRRDIGGLTWWRATAPEVTEALGGGISSRTVSWTVKQLTESGDLLAIRTHDFHGDRAKAYRVPDLTSATSDTGSDLTSATSDTAVGNIRHSPSARSDTAPMSDVADVPFTEEPKEEKQEPPSPPGAEVPPAHADDSANEAREQSNIPELIDAEIVPEERGQERGRSNPVDVSASRLVSMLVPTGIPSAVKTALRLKASELIRGDGVPPEVVAESLRRWVAKPDAGVGLLPYIAAEVLREATAPPPRSKLRDWAEFSNRIREIEREYLERHPDGVGLNEHLAAVVARESGSGAPRSKLRAAVELTAKLEAEEQRHSPGTGRAPSSKARTVAGWAAEARAAEEAGREPAAPLAIEAKVAPAPKLLPRQPEFATGANGQPCCRRHGHLAFAPARCDGCRAAAAAAGEAS